MGLWYSAEQERGYHASVQARLVEENLGGVSITKTERGDWMIAGTAPEYMWFPALMRSRLTDNAGEPWYKWFMNVRIRPGITMRVAMEHFSDTHCSACHCFGRDTPLWWVRTTSANHMFRIAWARERLLDDAAEQGVPLNAFCRRSSCAEPACAGDVSSWRQLVDRCGLDGTGIQIGGLCWNAAALYAALARHENEEVQIMIDERRAAIVAYFKSFDAAARNALDGAGMIPPVITIITRLALDRDRIKRDDAPLYEPSSPLLFPCVTVRNSGRNSRVSIA